jgi:hypothetical protein
MMAFTRRICDRKDSEVQNFTKIKSSHKRYISFITFSSVLLVAILILLPKSVTDSIIFAFSNTCQSKFDLSELPKVSISNLRTDESRVLNIKNKSATLPISYYSRIKEVKII